MFEEFDGFELFESLRGLWYIWSFWFSFSKTKNKTMDLVVSILRGTLGYGLFLGLMYLMSANRKAINWRIVAGGTILQLVGLWC